MPAAPSRTIRMLRNMFIGVPAGNYDRILDVSTPVTGTLFFVPPMAMLMKAPAPRPPISSQMSPPVLPPGNRLAERKLDGQLHRLLAPTARRLGGHRGRGLPHACAAIWVRAGRSICAGPWAMNTPRSTGAPPSHRQRPLTGGHVAAQRPAAGRTEGCLHAVARGYRRMSPAARRIPTGSRWDAALEAGHGREPDGL